MKHLINLQAPNANFYSNHKSSLDTGSGFDQRLYNNIKEAQEDAVGKCVAAWWHTETGKVKVVYRSFKDAYKHMKLILKTKTGKPTDDDLAKLFGYETGVTFRNAINSGESARTLHGIITAFFANYPL